jgi:CheY-like chemotaxis protein
MPKARPSCI